MFSVLPATINILAKFVTLP
jgi:hypothetical protein